MTDEEKVWQEIQQLKDGLNELKVQRTNLEKHLDDMTQLKDSLSENAKKAEELYNQVERMLE